MTLSEVAPVLSTLMVGAIGKIVIVLIAIGVVIGIVLAMMFGRARR
jgi:hypothetical protein